MPYPITDLHCDLLIYLARDPEANAYSIGEIGASVPHLLAGNVKHQVLALYVPTKAGSVQMGQNQVKAYQELLKEEHFHAVTTIEEAKNTLTTDGTGVTPALENASSLCEEGEKLDLAFERLDQMLDTMKHLFYIGFTHHYENRFGGGNYSDNVGLKSDGEKLLEYMSGRGIAADLAHASDQLAYGIINHIDKKGLEVPVIASHSNFRVLTDHVRNLPSELVQQVMLRKGLIGMNFLRAYIHETNPDFLIEHIRYGFHNTPDALAFGADFFDTKALNDPNRIPYFFPDHEDAGKFPAVLAKLRKHSIPETNLAKFCHQNVLAFIERNWR